MMNGKIIASNAGTYIVYSDGVNYTVSPKGSLKFKKKFLAVGDNVSFNENVIEDLEQRKNELIRPHSANIDNLFVIMSVVEPELSPELLYKFLTYANMNGIKASVIFTKIDRISDFSHLDTLKTDLIKLGYEVFYMSPNSDEEIEKVKSMMKNKVNLLMGQTGVGKSSFINLLDEAFDRKIGNYSVALGRGKHQTKEVILLPFEGGFVGDTPGFSSLELDLYKEDLAQYFPGYSDFYTQCYFSNCLHQNEKECKIKEQIEEGKLSKEGYQVYKKLLNELEYKSQRYK